MHESFFFLLKYVFISSHLMALSLTWGGDDRLTSRQVILSGWLRYSDFHTQGVPKIVAQVNVATLTSSILEYVIGNFTHLLHLSSL